ncbi:hypothetical protein Ancab_036430 [Ancistrocladus abbreviatus]
MEENGAQLMPIDRRPAALGELRVLPDEVIAAIIGSLPPRDVARLSCVSSVMYIFCNEEPLWMSLCLDSTNGLLQYKGSWKRTLLHQECIMNGEKEPHEKPLHFDGFSSLFLYRRLYRCYTRLDGFAEDGGNVERKKDLSLEEFHHEYDGKKPVLLTGLADTWPAKMAWTTEQLLLKYGDTAFKISQRSPHKIKMKFKDYVSYMKHQHDEDPLYIFDDKFGEVAPGLLKDYDVPHLFREDFFDVLERGQRPPFRWFIIGPERSGASWHVDPALTSAWNTLLCGRKRWALYPPGRVPLGVTVHVNEEDGDVNVETPTSLQWWLDYYPLLPDEDKPIEFTQLPGETIFVPSGWWHCVLNLETTIAVTQNFVNSKNFEFVCLDMAPGYRHKGVSRAGLLALDDQNVSDVDENVCSSETDLSSAELTKKGKRPRICKSGDDPNHHNAVNGAAICCNLSSSEFPYEINFLSTFLEEDRDHYNSIWSSGNCIGQREIREWLWKLWVGKPGIRDLIWKGACIALNAGKWLEGISKICEFHNLPSPTDDEKLPVGTGSNPVYLIAESVIKMYVERGLESSLYGLGTELEFYNLLQKVKSPLKDHVPEVLASGLIYLENGSYKVAPWDGKGLPEVIANCSFITEKYVNYSYPFGIWGKKLFEYRKAGMSAHELINSAGSTKIWPYIITKRCKGNIFAELREAFSSEEALNLASFLGDQLHNLHVLPIPSFDASMLSNNMESPNSINATEIIPHNSSLATKWEIFASTLASRKKDAASRLMKWGSPIPCGLIEKVNEYLPDDSGELIHLYEGKNCSWIHSDIMDDNIFIEPLNDSAADNCHTTSNGVAKSWQPFYILDFSDLTVDVFKGDVRLLKQFLASYKLPFLGKVSEEKLTVKDIKYKRLSYHAMCYCILHEENVLGAIFGMWEDLRSAKSWDEVEERVWGHLNDYNDAR